jgi:hypothetical protein
MTLDEIRRVVESLEAEVNNGGFDQYFFNSSGDDAAGALEALNEIGATRTAELLRGACSRFPGAMPSPERFRRQVDLLEHVNRGGDAFASLDSAFHAYPENIAVLLADHEATSE